MSEAERWLKDWHARHPGATARALGRGNPSSYETLAALAKAGDRALDVACGDGMLMERLLARGAAEVTGIDMSSEELAAARARLGDRARLLEGRAQALPFEDASFDVVTCHMALMLMDAPDGVVAEVRRVLRPGGVFGAVVGSAPASDGTWIRIVQIFAPALSGPSLGDRRTRSPEGLRDLLGAFEDVRIEPLSVDLSGPEEDVWQLFADTYMPAMLPEATAAAIESAARAALRDLRRPDGTVPCILPLTLVTARR